jgi:hypothetical protein
VRQELYPDPTMNLETVRNWLFKYNGLRCRSVIVSLIGYWRTSMAASRSKQSNGRGNETCLR